MALALDPAASEFFKDGSYVLEGEGKTLDAAQLVDLYEAWIGRYPIISIEDGMAEDDWDGLEAAHRPARRARSSWSATTCSSPTSSGSTEGIDKGVANSILIKVNQIGTLTETLHAIDARAHRAATRRSSRTAPARPRTRRSPTWSSRPASGMIKTGAPARAERVAKYNRLLAIEARARRGGAYYAQALEPAVKQASRAVHAGRELGGPQPAGARPQPRRRPRLHDLDDYDAVARGERPGHYYGRNSNEQPRDARAAVAELEGAEAGRRDRRRAWPRCTSRSSPSRRKPATIVATRELYGGTLALLRQDLEPAGYEAVFVDLADLDAVRRAHGRRRARAARDDHEPAVPACPTSRRSRAWRASAACRVLVDNTFATPDPLPAARARRRPW